MTGVITIVSGLPRSGTSMMMGMLQEGGMQVLIDGERIANADNPNGYFEFEPVKKTKEDPSWLEGAAGKAVKMVYKLLYDLPDAHEYKVVFVRRKMEEVIASQNKMLERENREPQVPDELMAQLFQGEIGKCRQWMQAKANISALEVSYNDLLTDTRATVESLCSFLDAALDADAMCAVVDPSLYRNRAT